MKSVKRVRNEIARKMTDRREGVSVALGQCDLDYDRIHIKFPAGGSVSLNPCWKTIIKNDFRISQIIDWWFTGKQNILLVRDKC